MTKRFDVVTESMGSKDSDEDVTTACSAPFTLHLSLLVDAIVAYDRMILTASEPVLSSITPPPPPNIKYPYRTRSIVAIV